MLRAGMRSFEYPAAVSLVMLRIRCTHNCIIDSMVQLQNSSTLQHFCIIVIVVVKNFGKWTIKAPKGGDEGKAEA